MVEVIAVAAAAAKVDKKMSRYEVITVTSQKIHQQPQQQSSSCSSCGTRDLLVTYPSTLPKGLSEI